MRIRSLAVFAFLCSGLLVGGCFFAAPQLSPQAQGYLNNAMRMPLEFSCPASRAPEAWGRALDFVTTYSDLRLRHQNDMLLETFNPDPSSFNFAYRVLQIPLGNGMVKFKVDCETEMDSDRANQNAHVLAYYMYYGGNLDPSLVNKGI